MSFPRYPAYKPSGVEWLGEVPEHWEVKRVSHLADLLTGPAWSSEKFSRNPEEGIPLVRGESIGEGFLRWHERGRYWPHSEEYDARYLLEAGDIVVQMDGSKVGKNWAMVLADDLPLLLVQRVTRVKPRLCIHRFLWWQIASPNFIANVDKAKTDPAIPHITMKDIGSFCVGMPSYNEQQKISTFLDHETTKIDALIAEQQRLIELLQEKRQAVISHAVTKGLNPDAPMRDSGVEWLGEVPEHWDIRPIKHLARVGNGSTPNRDNSDYWADHDGFPWLNSSVVNQAEVSEADRFVTKLALRECHLPIIDPPAVLVGITGQGRTRGMASKLMFEATISQHIAYIQPDLHQLTVDFLLCALEAAYERLRFDSEGSGSTKGAITCEQLGLMRMPVPSPPEQVEIVSFLQLEIASNVALKAQSEHAIRLLQERRSALISAAVTGQIDVRGLVPEAVAA